MNKRYTILVIEDEKGIRGFIATVLNANRYTVIQAENGKEAMMMIHSYCPDLVLLDLGLPDMEGMDIIRQVREWSDLPIVVVSARENDGDKVGALDLGADDYVTKPFSPSELLARIRTALRHSVRRMGSAAGNNVFETGGLRIDFDKREVLVDGEVIHLTQMEYKIVSLLCQNAGRVLTYDAMIRHIWGPNAKCDNQILRVNMAHIRRKLEKNPAEPEYIYTEVGVGYRMREDAGR